MKERGPRSALSACVCMHCGMGQICCGARVRMDVDYNGLFLYANSEIESKTLGAVQMTSHYYIPMGSSKEAARSVLYAQERTHRC